VIQAYNKIVSISKKILSFVGDYEFSETETLLNQNLGDIENSSTGEKTFPTPEVKEAKTVEIIKNDAQQAQIIQGWIVPAFNSEDYPALVLLNVILGSAGLSSRLFLN